MKEAGDGVQTQMNSMMGVLHELKLLQVQTALEQLQISCKPSQLSQHPLSEAAVSGTPLTGKLEHVTRGTRQKDTRISERSKNHTFKKESSLSDQEMEPCVFLTSSPFEKSSLAPCLVSKRQEPRGNHHQGSVCTSASFCSSDNESFSSHGSQETAPLSHSHSALRSMCDEHQPEFQPATMAELQGLMDTLSREGPSIDSDFSHCDTDDSSDWTSSLMSHSRNRQPLVLGDNVLADLVGNWLNLPELEGRMVGDGEKAAAFAEVSGSPLRLSCSGEFCRRLSLTASIFKKVLRSVRPDRDKLLKERPGWQVTEQEEQELFKRSQKKSKGSKSKRSFYRPFWARAGGLRGKSRSQPDNVEEIRGAKGPTFDYSFAVWV
ncbi:PAK4-inhibitor INKA2 isoform X2 [Brachyhypopomus gauderio]